MTDVLKALIELNVGHFVLNGEPTNESEFNSMYRKTTGEPDSELISDPSQFGVTWAQVSAKMTELENAEPMRLLRQERNRLLAETDWWAMSDRTMTTEQTTYRQSLRDITDTYSSLDTVVWPTKP